MWYTRKGDDGTTGSFGTKERMKKSSLRAEGLGSLDELNSWLGLVKVKSGSLGALLGIDPTDLVHRLQSDLFIIQAELAGAEMTIGEAGGGYRRRRKRSATAHRVFNCGWNRALSAV